jgi:curved DNA-binding protein CbpA
MNKNHYTTLGVPQSATQVEIKKAYRKLSLQYHPDRNGGSDAFTEQFKEVQAAYEVLGNEVKRKNYDVRISRPYSFQSSPNSTHKKARSQNTNNPIIQYFTADKSEVEYNGEITFSWVCINAQAVEIQPFGIFKTSDTKTFKLKNFDKEKLSFKIIAQNTYTQKQVSQTITVTNSTYCKLRDKIIREYKAKQNSQKNIKKKEHKTKTAYEQKYKSTKKKKSKKKRTEEEEDSFINMLFLTLGIGLFAIIIALIFG